VDRKRVSSAIAAFIVLGVVFFLALFRIQILQYNFYKQKAEVQQRRFIRIATDRGDIVSSDGAVLATSLSTYSIYTNTGEFKWIKRKLDRPPAEKLPGMVVIEEKKRVYPNAHLASQVVGFTGADNEGLAGIEQAYDEYLRSKEGWIKTYADPIGFEFLQAKSKKLDTEEDGMNIVLTINQKIQYAVERELSAAIKKFSAISGTAVMMDLKDGGILALASKPDFDPNNYSKFDPKTWNSRACLVYEPGSTFKLITAASGLDQGTITIDSKLQALNQIVVGGKTIGNSHQINWPGKEISISYALEQSINTAMAQISMKLGKEKFYNHIKAFGFGEKTGFGLDGESSGILRHYNNWYTPDIAMLSFGQSIAVTPMQLLAAVGSFGKEGLVLKPHLVKRIESRDGSYVKSYSAEYYGRSVSKKTAEEMLGLMENIVLKGSGRHAKIKGYHVGGKTGTAQKVAVGSGAYMKGNYIASFIGIAPLKKPRLVCLVIIDDPKGSIWGESTAAPVFQRVVDESLRYLNVPPDGL